MKTAKNFVSTALLIAAMFTSPVLSRYAAGQSGDVPSKDEVTTLLKTASTPLEHHRIAMYYKEEASRLNQEAAFHRAYANVYGIGQGFSHCSNLARFDEQAAKEATALQAMHEKMAKVADQKQ